MDNIIDILMCIGIGSILAGVVLLGIAVILVLLS